MSDRVSIEDVKGVLREIMGVCAKHVCADCPLAPEGRDCLVSPYPYQWQAYAIADALQAHREASHE
jgi:hypothetical protein